MLKRKSIKFILGIKGCLKYPPRVHKEIHNAHANRNNKQRRKVSPEKKIRQDKNKQVRQRAAQPHVRQKLPEGLPLNIQHLLERKLIMIHKA